MLGAFLSLGLAGCAGGGGAVLPGARVAAPPVQPGPVIAVWPGSDGRHHAIHADPLGRPTGARPQGWPRRPSPIRPLEAGPAAARHVRLLDVAGGTAWICPRFPAVPAGEAFSEPAEDVLAEYGVPGFPRPDGEPAFVAAWYAVEPGTREVDLRVLLPASLHRPDRLRFDLDGETIPIRGADGRVGAVLERLVGRPHELVRWLEAVGGGHATFATAEGVLEIDADGRIAFRPLRATDGDR